MEEIVFRTEMETAPRAASHPQNQKIEDSLLGHTYYTKDEAELLGNILDYYIETRYADVVV